MRRVLKNIDNRSTDTVWAIFELFKKNIHSSELFILAHTVYQFYIDLKMSLHYTLLAKVPV